MENVLQRFSWISFLFKRPCRNIRQNVRWNRYQTLLKSNTPRLWTWQGHVRGSYGFVGYINKISRLLPQHLIDASVQMLLISWDLPSIFLWFMWALSLRSNKYKIFRLNISVKKHVFWSKHIMLSNTSSLVTIYLRVWNYQILKFQTEKQRARSFTYWARVYHINTYLKLLFDIWKCFY